MNLSPPVYIIKFECCGSGVSHKLEITVIVDDLSEKNKPTFLIDTIDETGKDFWAGSERDQASQHQRAEHFGIGAGQSRRQ